MVFLEKYLKYLFLSIIIQISTVTYLVFNKALGGGRDWSRWQTGTFWTLSKTTVGGVKADGIL